MFDINLLNKPGLQVNSNDNYDMKIKKRIEQKPPREVNNNNNRYYMKIFVFLSLLCLALIGIYNKNNFSFNFQSLIKDEAVIDYDLIDLLINQQDLLKVRYIQFGKEKNSIKLNANNNNDFYTLLDAFSELIGNKIKGYHYNNNYLLEINCPRKLNKDKNIDLNHLNKELSDINPTINKEIYKNKLIIVSDIQNILSILYLISKINLLDNYLINIKNIESLPNNIDLYQLIIQ